MESPRTVNEDMVDAQKARRVLDRLVGYKLSGLLWKKIWYGLSAGRVQSVATRLIVERERERDAFKPDEFWNVRAHLKKEKGPEFITKLAKKDTKKFLPGKEKECEDMESDVKGAKWEIVKVEKKEKKQKAPAPFTTATLQRSANHYLGYSTKRTMQLAQQLYQGVDIKGKGHVGLITYMRTDSTHLSKQAIDQMRKFIGKEFGKEYVPAKAHMYKTKSRLAQEAHEAIRPTRFDLPLDGLKKSLTPQQFKLYSLIWNRALACQMESMTYNQTDVNVDVTGKSKAVYTFTVKGKEVLFDGYAKLLGSSLLKIGDDDQDLAGLKEGDAVTCKKIGREQKFTKPRARYTEATLVKDLEKYGIGRPSTYATIISTIQNRGYVGREQRYLFPTDVGYVVNDFLVEHFPDIVDFDFTSEVEDDLDDVANGEQKWVPVVKKVYEPMEKTIGKKEKEVKKEDVVILGKSDIPCPECGGKMVIRIGRNGKFLSCATFPKCKGMLGMDGKTMEESFDKKKYRKSEPCEKCSAKMVLKSGKYGQFWACEKYPDCKSTAPLLLKEECPECDSPLVERKGKWGKPFTGCSGYPKCRYIKKVKKGEGEEKTPVKKAPTKKTMAKKAPSKKK